MTVDACPFCDDSSITANATGGRGTETRGRFRCTACGRFFDEPVTRERRQHNEQRRGLAGDLASADPDEVGL